MTTDKKVFEFEGKNVRDAVEKALKKLNVSREDITVRILSEEKLGLFGMPGEKLAKIHVELKRKTRP